MSHYTTTLRRLIEPTANVGTWKRIDGVWIPESNNSGFELFDSQNTYPLIFDNSAKIGGFVLSPVVTIKNSDGTSSEIDFSSSSYRSELNKKILNHYFDYEIGFETPQLFKHHFNTLLNEIMPEYNSKFYALIQDIASNIPYSFWERTDYNGKQQTGSEIVTDYTHGDVKSWDYKGNVTKNSDYTFDTPQNISSLNPDSPDHMSDANVGKSFNASGYVDSSGNITQDFADSHATAKESRGADKTTVTGDASKNYFEFVGRNDIRQGFDAQKQMQINEMLKKSLTEFGNIDLQIINALRDCFMYIY